MNVLSEYSIELLSFIQTFGFSWLPLVLFQQENAGWHLVSAR